VRGRRRAGEAPCHRTHVDDASAAPLLHVRQARFDAAQAAEVVRLHARLEIRQGHLFDRSHALNPCVVHKCVDVAGFCADRSELTSSVVMVAGNFSSSPNSRSAGARPGLRIVAWPWWPALARATAVAKPIPELQPVISTFAMGPSFVGAIIALTARRWGPKVL